MTIFGTSGEATDPGGDVDEAVVRRASRRDTFEAVTFLMGVLGILLGLTVVMGAPLPTGP